MANLEWPSVSPCLLCIDAIHRFHPGNLWSYKPTNNWQASQEIKEIVLGKEVVLHLGERLAMTIPENVSTTLRSSDKASTCRCYAVVCFFKDFILLMH